MIIRILSKEFYLRIGSPLLWVLSFLTCGFFCAFFMKLLWMIG
jgi:hypothetical protein